MKLTEELLLRLVDRQPPRGGQTFRQQVEQRLEARLDKVGRRIASLEAAAAGDWWVLLYASWLAMNSEREATR